MALSEPGPEVEATVRRSSAPVSALTQGLAKSWGLTGTLGLALGNGRGDPAAEAVRLGASIAQVALDGWDGPAMAEQAARVAAFIGLGSDDALQHVLGAADEAVRVATTFGAEPLLPLIPTREPMSTRASPPCRAPVLDADALSQALHELGLAAARQEARDASSTCCPRECGAAPASNGPWWRSWPITNVAFAPSK